jgi:cobalamin biosynthesis protein CobD/CbiB
VYSFPEPPYFLLIFGLFAGITSGAAFEATLKQRVQEWAKNRSTRSIAQLKGVQLLLPFLGIATGVCLFLTAGLEIFGFPTWLSYYVSIPLTLGTSALVWSQLGKLLVQLERGGSKALDLDS